MEYLKLVPFIQGHEYSLAKKMKMDYQPLFQLIMTVNSVDGLALTELLGNLDLRFSTDARLAKNLIDTASSVPNQSWRNIAR